MDETSAKSLLPDGLRDVLPPVATAESNAVRGLIDCFRSQAYRRVDPPLVEFETSLLDGPGAAISRHTFRLMDPVTQQMMGVRADMTVQVARIATTRLINWPRPLRLCYAGPTLRVRGSQLRPERQVTQAGCELIGIDSPEADAEVIALAADALGRIGVSDLSVDLCMPTVVPAVMDALGLTAEQRAAAREALDRKDAHDVAALGGKAAEILGNLLRASGPAPRALDRLRALDLPDAAAKERERLAAVLALLEKTVPDLGVTVDAVENRGFEYQTGLSFAFFAKNTRGELGRGGRYAAGPVEEAATGFSLYLDSVMRALPEPVEDAIVFLPYGSDPARAKALRDAGWIVTAGLSPVADVRAEAARLHCTHISNGDGNGSGGAPVPLYDRPED